MYYRIMNCYTWHGVCSYENKNKEIIDVDIDAIEAKDGDSFFVMYTNSLGMTEGVVYIPEEKMRDFGLPKPSWEEAPLREETPATRFESFEEAWRDAIELMEPLKITMPAKTFIELCEKNEIPESLKKTLLAMSENNYTRLSLCSADTPKPKRQPRPRLR